MPVSKRKGSPYYQYNFKLNGFHFRGSCKTKDIELAKAFEAKERTKVYHELQLGKKPSITIEEACDEYYKNHLAFIKNPKTNLPILGFFKDFFKSNTLLERVDSRMVVNAIHHLGKEKNLAPISILRYFDIFKAMVNRMETQGYQIPRLNWTQLLKSVRERAPDARIRYLSKNELERLINNATDYLKPVIIFAIHTGLRKANIVNLKWNNVDFDRKTIHVRVKSKKIDGKLHTISMTNYIYKMLDAMHETRQSDYVFTRDGVNSLGNFRKAWIATLERAKIEDFRFHDLRHTHASFIVMDSGRLDIVQKSLGHSNINTTLRYAHLSQESIRDTLNNTFMSQLEHIKDGGNNDN